LVLRGHVIEDYPDDTPFPSCLLGLEVDRRWLHAVVALDATSGRCCVVTVCEPSPERWEDGMTRRKTR